MVSGDTLFCLSQIASHDSPGSSLLDSTALPGYSERCRCGPIRQKPEGEVCCVRSITIDGTSDFSKASWAALWPLSCKILLVLGLLSSGLLMCY